MLTTPRLVLRRFRPSDSPALIAYRSDPQVARFQSWTLLDAAASLAAGDPDEAGWFQYAIERTADRTLIGDVGVNTHENLMQAEIGFTLARPAQGQGYATEAVTAVLDHLFQVRGLHKVSAECDARNTASERLLTRLGFTLEGKRRQHTWINGEWTDDLVFGMLTPEWINQPE
ncbi:GNAT family protein [Actinoplanes sp. NBRC 103695]|uniref:GNAT family N-acetyltransferase n=1 Tax=Actinoplanes sp. NBRC 103695 TaxID=3032202 RepID=UPI0024A539F1|nr:GNAT family protein [Actinoplanes sp. NBRC 103695]GLY98550.1 N-acetyltransferase [Actinoplanes sp. NBRC 103695]